MYFIGIDPGKKDLKTTGICILIPGKRGWRVNAGTVFGRKIIKVLSGQLKYQNFYAIEAPVSYGQGKGKMRLWEKYFSQKSFRKRNTSPLPPAFMGKVIENSMEIVNFLEQNGVKKDEQMIETFYPLLKLAVKKRLLPKVRKQLRTVHEFQAFYCAYLSYLHSLNETFWIGYKDGKVFLPKPKYWYKREWRWFEKAWKKKDLLKYKFLESDFLDNSTF